MANDTLSKSQRIGILQQSKASNHWNTPQLITAAMKEMYYDAGVSIFDPDVVIDQNQSISRYGIYDEYERQTVDNTAGLPSINFKGNVVLSQVAPHLVAALQACTEGASTPFEKVITGIGISSVPDFTANEGFLWSVAGINKNVGSASDAWLLQDALLDRYELTFEVNNRGHARYLQHAGVWKGRKITYSASGVNTTSWVAQPDTPTFVGISGAFDLDLTLNSLPQMTSLCYKRFKLTIENGLFADCRGAGGIANNFKITPKITLELMTPYLDESLGLYLANYEFQQGAVNDIVLEHGTSGQAGHFKIAIPCGIMKQTPESFDGDYMARTMIFDVKSRSAATPLTVTLSDAVDWGF